MKNFTGYTPMSRVIVPRDLVGDPHDLRVRAWIDGKLHQDASTDEMLWHVGEVVEYLSYIMTLQPGDLILEFADGHTLLCRVSGWTTEPSIISWPPTLGS